jgi:antitoxin (DNA-binding transcriptional repressor) of toxin-antitoxin stability system
MDMARASFTEFRKDAARYLDLVERGESVEVTRHGTVVAEIRSPYAPSAKAWKRPVKPLTVPGLSLSKELLKDRKRSRG